MSVASFASKSKKYSKTESLDSRVAIAAGIQILGYETFWEEIYDEFGLEMNCNLRLFFRKLQQKKDKNGRCWKATRVSQGAADDVMTSSKKNYNATWKIKRKACNTKRGLLYDRHKINLNKS